MLYVLIGTRGNTTREEVMKLYPEHKVLLDKYIEKGEVLGAGAFLDSEGGNMGIFKTYEAAQEFSKNDPFYIAGAIKEYKIKEWDNIIN